MKTKSIVWLTLLIALLAAERAVAISVAGKVDVLKGTVTATGPDGRARALERGRPVFEGDQISTARRSAVALEFRDGTRFALGSESSMSVDQFVFGKSPEEDTFSAKVLKGAFRFLTGLVAKKKPKSMQVQLGITATIGIRGTNVAGELVGDAVSVMLLEPEDSGRKTAIDVFNDHGTVTIDEPGYGTEVPDANSPPSPARRMRLRTIDNLMRSMQSITRGMIRPRMSTH